ncbi:P-loop containing nucleoside triphosphate hydrolase protein [Gautieria morchelliformis]|nr:P-loop containing nucleoside triphosphate hydrolase protein [Gautieria morchelliformis]
MSLVDQQSSEPTPPQNRIARYDQYFDLRTFSDTLRKTHKPVKKRVSDKKPALIVVRIINHKGQLERTEIEIKSQALCDVLMDINSDVQGLELNRNPPLANPKLFFYSHFGLENRLEKEQSKDLQDVALIADLKVALQYIEEDHGNNIADFKKLTAHEEITYVLLWALFAPNTLVYYYHHMTEQAQILIARSVLPKQRRDLSRYTAIECDFITNDGTSFGLARNSLEIDPFVGARRIQHLTVYPLKYHKDKDAICGHAVSRGRKFVTLNKLSHSYNEISGLAMRETRIEKGESMTKEGEPKRFKFNTYGRVMIDPAAFRIFEPNCTFNLPVYKRLDPDRLTDEQCMICTPILLGFCFGVKMWGGFAMDRLEDIVWTDEAFRLLVLGVKQKKLIYSLVKQHVAHSKHFDDVVRGKGKGIIGLLSGAPGTGKTLTAEAVAEITRRPLYVVTAGELGIEPSDLDQRLAKILELAQMWDAVLLLDEAEVFLQKRSGTDVKRNALVSIFLRQLEYYQGILILTTNMIEQCDAAFESRIHFSIKYPDLDFESRKAIWRTFYGKVAESAGEISDEELNRLARHSMNGRQIKNAVGSAQCIALESGASFSTEHIDTVLDVVSDWNRGRPNLPDSMI